MTGLWEKLEEVKKLKWVELSHPLNDDSPYWEGMPAGVREIGKTVVDFPDMNLKIQTFKFPGQFGTHIDYPGHFDEAGILSEKYTIVDTVFPLVVIDVSEKVKENPDYELTIQDILDHESKYGRIPEQRCAAEGIPN